MDCDSINHGFLIDSFIVACNHFNLKTLVHQAFGQVVRANSSTFLRRFKILVDIQNFHGEQSTGAILLFLPFFRNNGKKKLKRMTRIWEYGLSKYSDHVI